MEIGETIYNQLGDKTLFMIGAKNLTVNKKAYRTDLGSTEFSHDFPGGKYLKEYQDY